jgi:uncharacterized protein (TIGR03067 family)
MRLNRLVFTIGMLLTLAVLAVGASLFAYHCSSHKAPTLEASVKSSPANEIDTLARNDREKLQGAWILARTEWNGRVVQEEGTTGKCVISGERIDLRPRIQWDRRLQGGNEPVDFSRTDDVERVTGTYKLDLARQPRRMTITGTWLNPLGAVQETFHVLYRLDGDTLTLLLPPPRVEPPDELKTCADSGLQLLVFRREPADQQKLTGLWKLIETEQDGKFDRRKNRGGFCSIGEDDRLSLCNSTVSVIPFD